MIKYLDSIRWKLVRALGGDKPTRVEIHDMYCVPSSRDTVPVCVKGNHVTIRSITNLTPDEYIELKRRADANDDKGL